MESRQNERMDAGFLEVQRQFGEVQKQFGEMHKQIASVHGAIAARTRWLLVLAIGAITLYPLITGLIELWLR